MAELIEIRRVEIGPENLIARVRLSEDAPLMTSEDPKGTTRVYRLLPHIVEHVCIGDAGSTFREAMGNTELAHLLEHVTVELLAQTDLAGDMPAGRTWVDEVDDRTYEIELACPDDALVAAALSCGVWILDWAYSGGGDPAPDVNAIVDGLVNLIDSIEGQGDEYVVDVPVEDDEPVAEGEDEQVEPAEEPEATVVRPAPQPLWTPAPDVPHAATRARREAEQRSPEVEAEIDEIMATIEFPVQAPREEIPSDEAPAE